MPNSRSLGALVAIQLAVSAASLVVEIVAGRMLAPYVGMSLYTWTAVIAVVLAGFSAGHWWGGRIAGRAPAAALRRTGWIILAAATTTALAGVLLAGIAGPVLASIGHPVLAIVTLAGLVFFLPSFFAGVPAPVLAQIAVAAEPAEQSGRALGALFAAGAAGAIAGVLMAGFVFISWLGSSGTLVVVTLVYGATALGCFALSRPGLNAAPVLAALAISGAALASLMVPGQCDRESRYFCIRTLDVSADADQPVRMMVLDHLVHGMSARDLPGVMFTDHAAMLDALARLRAPRSDFTSFFLGGGTYSIPRAFAMRGAGPVTVAEIDPAVTETAVRDFWFDPAPARVLHEDARRALLTRPDRYDVVIGDAFTDIAVPAHLITREFFELVQARLEPGGSYLMNVIDFEDRLEALGAVTRTLSEVFEVVEVWTIAAPPEPGARMVFVIAAGDAPTPADSFAVPSPDRTVFGALDGRFVDEVMARGTLILTDDYAPIDRLLGPGG
ncbi:fused MFS/spermidine synthase [Anianabacter salinae]|uniref:fused MFS/spermidine synthase n=1 Tax=Anianabacter salinae TaxID=2851023 RepID=UPI00225E249F|nr:fused MFS/spermidine synthase [Anianabacter salinae]MBV0912228.1 fused MFS/spermidine synthase [Anianabacter salinae]